MNETVKRTVLSNDLFSRGDRVLVGLSGGADSVALLHVLLALQDEIGLVSIRACHFNHGLRGLESDSDEAFVQALCERLEVELVCARGEMASSEKPQGESIESWARKLRYAFFEQTARDGEKIALAHNRNDCVETALFHLARGTGLKGLRGIPVKRGRYVRPLIEVSRAEIEAYCAENQLDYRTDSTNLDIQYARNRIRRNILPEFEMINDGAVNNMFRLCALAGEASDYFDRAAAQLLHTAALLDGWSASTLLEADPLIVRFALKILLETVILTISEDTVARAQAVLRGQAKRCELTSGIFFSRHGNLVFIERQDSTAVHPALQAGDDTVEIALGVSALSSGVSVCAKKQSVYEENTGKFTKKDLNNSVDYDKIVGKLFLRTRREGDHFAPFGRGVTKSLKKLFNEAQIPPEQRDRIPVVCDADGIVWIQGFGVCARAACDHQTKEMITFS